MLWTHSDVRRSERGSWGPALELLSHISFQASSETDHHPQTTATVNCQQGYHLVLFTTTSNILKASALQRDTDIKKKTKNNETRPLLLCLRTKAAGRAPWATCFPGLQLIRRPEDGRITLLHRKRLLQTHFRQNGRGWHETKIVFI